MDGVQFDLAVSMEERGRKRLHDQYIKLKRVGQGHFGRAILVQSKHDRKFYVMKTMEVCQMDRRERENALKEVKLLKSLKSPFVIGYKESFISESNDICIIMEYAERGDLQKIIKEQAGKGPFEEALVLRWFAQICLALSHIHRQKIMHRDLKTANIFVTAASNCKVGDFGISKTLKQTDDLANTKIGTPSVMAPEVWSGEPYDKKSDIWALGCVLYQLLALKPPFVAAYPLVLANKILEGKFQPLPPHVNPQLRKLVDLLLSTQAKRRPSISKLLEYDIIKQALFSLAQGIKDKVDHERKMSHVLIPQTNSLPEVRNNSLSCIVNAGSTGANFAKARNAPSMESKLALHGEEKPSESTCNTLRKHSLQSHWKEAQPTTNQRLEVLRTQLEGKMGEESLLRVYGRIKKEPEYRFGSLLLDRQIRLLIELEEQLFGR